MEDTDDQLHLKKRARRRLVGAVAFVVLVAVVLPMIMDQEPKPVAQDVEIRIPGQDEKPFAPKFAVAPVEKAPAEAPEPEEPDAAAEKPAQESPEKPAEPASRLEPNAKLIDKPLEKAPLKPTGKDEKAATKPHPEGEAKRAAAILAGQAEESRAKAGEHVVLIGAFANESNVKTLRNKLSELGIKVYTEPLESPQGRKTRVRAGPFPSRDAAEKALDKMRRIGISGVVAAKQ